MNPLITFLPSKTEYQAQKGENLLDIAGKAHVMVEGNCGGAGSCGKCRVQIIEGVATAPTDAEKKLLSAKDLQEGYRLACHTEVIDDDLLVIVEQRHETILRKSNLRSLVGDFAIDSLIKKYYLQLAEPSMEDQLGDVERILAALPEDCTFNPLVLGELPNVLRDNGFKVTAVVKNKEVISVEAGDTSQRCYGIAFDIGTTTVVGMLLDLHDGKAVACSAATNPQNIFGSDVISRITYVITNPASRQLMKKRMRDCINNIISDFQDVCDVKNEEIYDATVVGNTTMSHLFLGLDPSALSRAPFIPVFCHPMDMPASDMELNIHPLACIHLLPNIAGYVGSDTVGVMLATDLHHKKGLHLAIDVGTNGEVALAKDGRMLTCSTAAGPAFEGASIKDGMRAASGAIEGVLIKDGEVELDVIDDAKPIGLCGSGLIDAVAQLLDAGLVLKTGKFVDPAKPEADHLPQSLKDRLQKGQGGREFVLVWADDSASGHDIVICQKDLRELQLAKAAIYAGIKIMLGELGSQPEDIDSIMLAGAFGNYIKKESAMAIGLFPADDIDKIISVGNAAGDGARMALLSEDKRAEAWAIAQEAEHMELSIRCDFQDEFIRAINFPVKKK